MESTTIDRELDSAPGVPERLVMAGTAEFVRHGFQGASISTIVGAANCNVRMVYHYFGNKLGLYRACIARAYGHLRDAEAQAGFWNAPPRDAIAELVRFTFDYMLNYPEFQGLMRVENMADGQHVREVGSVNDRAASLFGRMNTVLDNGLRDGSFQHRPDAGALYLSILGLCTIHIANRHTMQVVMGRDLACADFLVPRREEVVRIVLASLGAS
ncbi:TetR/AcrR family transcriptional regulator [Roseinatronobacter sp. NSM]|uniref:TetR/AcrR family transcriptional regulator n=1 Tax=Roseinatronobacter sp. NSM TaxID=3457785 RepID=UPI004035BB4F